MHKLRYLPLALFASAVLAACDSPIDPTAHVEGVVILNASGSEVARFLDADNSVSGGVSVDVGETAIFRVRGLDGAGGQTDLAVNAYSIANPGVVITRKAGITAQGADQLVIEGLEAGTTSIRFQLMHGDHEEFFVDGIPLTIGG